jgi:GT2 family glycosyltransferase
VGPIGPVSLHRSVTSGASLSVIVPVRDGATMLPGLLESLQMQTLPSDRFEVIVVDNGSRDDGASVARAKGATVLEDSIPGRARARNRGAAAAAGNRLAFIDADCVANPGWLEALAGCAGSKPLIAGPVILTTGEPPNKVERFERLWRFAQEAWVQQGWAATANLLVERDAFETIGGFDEAYRSIGEDADFCIRASRQGFELGYCPEAEVRHAGEDRMWPMLKRCFWHGYSSAQASRRIGAGYAAWRHPRPLLVGAEAARSVGLHEAMVTPGDWPTMRRLARGAYAFRVAGSLWSELERAR